jgi:hypothetical protein
MLESDLANPNVNSNDLRMCMGIEWPKEMHLEMDNRERYLWGRILTERERCAWDRMFDRKMCNYGRMTKICVCMGRIFVGEVYMHWTGEMLDVYVGTDDQERCLWERLTDGSVHGTGRPIKVGCAWTLYNMCMWRPRERCMQDLIAERGACKIWLKRDVHAWST